MNEEALRLLLETRDFLIWQQYSIERHPSAQDVASMLIERIGKLANAQGDKKKLKTEVESLVEMQGAPAAATK